MRSKSQEILKKHYQTEKIGVRIYNFLRLIIFPVDWLSKLLSDFKGKVLCLGCGYGVIETILAVNNPQLFFIASDLDKNRISAAQKMVKNVPNINFSVLNVEELSFPSEDTQNILFIDLIHHVRSEKQIPFLEKVWSLVPKGGALIMKDVDVRPKWKYWWNYVHDSLMAGPPLHYRSSEEYERFFMKKGASVILKKPVFLSPYNHYCLIARKFA